MNMHKYELSACLIAYNLDYNPIAWSSNVLNA